MTLLCFSIMDLGIDYYIDGPGLITADPASRSHRGEDEYSSLEDMNPTDLEQFQRHFSAKIKANPSIAYDPDLIKVVSQDLQNTLGISGVQTSISGVIAKRSKIPEEDLTYSQRNDLETRRFKSELDQFLADMKAKELLTEEEKKEAKELFDLERKLRKRLNDPKVVEEAEIRELNEDVERLHAFVLAQTETKLEKEVQEMIPLLREYIEDLPLEKTEKMEQFVIDVNGVIRRYETAKEGKTLTAEILKEIGEDMMDLIFKYRRWKDVLQRLKKLDEKVKILEQSGLGDDQFFKDANKLGENIELPTEEEYQIFLAKYTNLISKAEEFEVGSISMENERVKEVVKTLTDSIAELQFVDGSGDVLNPAKIVLQKIENKKRIALGVFEELKNALQRIDEAKGRRKIFLDDYEKIQNKFIEYTGASEGDKANTLWKIIEPWSEMQNNQAIPTEKQLQEFLAKATPLIEGFSGGVSLSPDVPTPLPDISAKVKRLKEFIAIWKTFKQTNLVKDVVERSDSILSSYEKNKTEKTQADVEVALESFERGQERRTNFNGLYLQLIDKEIPKGVGGDDWNEVRQFVDSNASIYSQEVPPTTAQVKYLEDNLQRIIQKIEKLKMPPEAPELAAKRLEELGGLYDNLVKEEIALKDITGADATKLKAEIAQTLNSLSIDMTGENVLTAEELQNKKQKVDSLIERANVLKKEKQESLTKTKFNEGYEKINNAKVGLMIARRGGDVDVENMLEKLEAFLNAWSTKEPSELELVDVLEEVEKLSKESRKVELSSLLQTLYDAVGNLEKIKNDDVGAKDLLVKMKDLLAEWGKLQSAGSIPREDYFKESKEKMNSLMVTYADVKRRLVEKQKKEKEEVEKNEPEYFKAYQEATERVANKIVRVDMSFVNYVTPDVLQKILKSEFSIEDLSFGGTVLPGMIRSSATKEQIYKDWNAIVGRPKEYNKEKKTSIAEMSKGFTKSWTKDAVDELDVAIEWIVYLFPFLLKKHDFSKVLEDGKALFTLGAVAREGNLYAPISITAAAERNWYKHLYGKDVPEDEEYDYASKVREFDDVLQKRFVPKCPETFSDIEGFCTGWKTWAFATALGLEKYDAQKRSLELGNLPIFSKKRFLEYIDTALFDIDTLSLRGLLGPDGKRGAIEEVEKAWNEHISQSNNWVGKKTKRFSISKFRGVIAEPQNAKLLPFESGSNKKVRADDEEAAILAWWKYLIPSESLNRFDIDPSKLAKAQHLDMEPLEPFDDMPDEITFGI